MWLCVLIFYCIYDSSVLLHRADRPLSRSRHSFWICMYMEKKICEHNFSVLSYSNNNIINQFKTIFIKILSENKFFNGFSLKKCNKKKQKPTTSKYHKYTRKKNCNLVFVCVCVGILCGYCVCFFKLCIFVDLMNL